MAANRSNRQEVPYERSTNLPDEEASRRTVAMLDAPSRDPHRQGAHLPSRVYWPFKSSVALRRTDNKPGQSRLLMTFPPRQPKRWRDAEMSPATQLAYADCIHGLFELQGEDSATDSKPATLKLSSEARSLISAYVDATGLEQAAMHGHLASQWSKLEEIPARLAIILHCVRQVTTGVADHWTIDGPTMQSAINLAEWFKSETLRIGRTLVELEAIREARHLAKWIQSQGGRITARDLFRMRRDIVSTDAAELKLMELVELGLGTWQGIHKSREFVLNE